MRNHPLRQSIGPKMPSYSKQRNIRDPLYKQQCINKISSFLPEVDPKSLELPTVKEFQALFRYFYQQIEPSTEILDTKFDEEAISFLKMMKYPFMTEITRSQLISITPHSWPALLSMLTWLCEITSTLLSEEDESLDFLFFNFISESFKEYMLSGTENKEKEEFFRRKYQEILKNEEEITKEKKAKLKENLEIKFDFQNKEINEFYKISLPETKGKLISDIPEVLRNIKLRNEALIKKENYDLMRVKELDLKNKEYNLENESLKSELFFWEEEEKRFLLMKEELRNKIKNQGMTHLEVSSLKSKEASLIKQREEIKLKNKEYFRSKSEQEIIFNKSFMELERIINEFNKEKENKRNKDDLLNITLENVLSKDLNYILLRIKEILGEYSIKFQFSYSERNTVLQRKTETDRIILDLNLRIKELNEEIIALSDQYLKIKERYDLSKIKHEKEYDNLIRSIDKLKMDGEENIVTAEQELSLAQTKLDLCMVNLVNEKEKLEREIDSCVEGVTNRISVIDGLLLKIQNIK